MVDGVTRCIFYALSMVASKGPFVGLSSGGGTVKGAGTRDRRYSSDRIG